jgi:IS1 family transposase
VQLDEKWSFVAKKQARCDPEQDRADHRKGDCWDHLAFDPEHRLVLDVEFGKRSATRVLSLLKRVKARLADRTPRLVTSDEFTSYATLLPRIWPAAPAEPRPDKRCTRRARTCDPPPQPEPDPALNYATVCKQREGGRVTSVRTEVVFGTKASVAQALAKSKASTAINTSFLERHNATDRHHNARKARRTYRFSKDWATHAAVGRFTLFTYNFCSKVRTLRRRRQRQRCRRRRQRGGPRMCGRKRGRRRAARLAPRYQERTPAMAAGLTDHVWPLAQWLARPTTQLST